MAVESLHAQGRRKRGLFATGLETFSLRVIAAAGALLLTVVVSQNVSTGAFADFSYCFVLMTMLSMAARFGTDSTLLRFAGTAWHDKNPELFSEYARLSISIALRLTLAFMAMGALGLTLFWDRWDASTTFGWTLICLLPWTLNFTISFVFRAAQHPQLGTCYEPGVACLITAIVVLGMARLGFVWSAASITVALTAVAGLSCLLGCFLASRMGLLRYRRLGPPGIDKHSFMLASTNCAVVVIMQVLANWGGSFFLELQGDKTQLAMFLAAVRITSVTTVALNVVVLLVSPRLAGLYSSSPGHEFMRLANRASLAAFLASLLPLMILLLGADWIMSWLGESPADRLTFVEHSYLLQIVAVGQLVGTFTALAPTLLSMTGHDQALRNSTIFVSLISIGLSAVLSHLYGASGAAVASGLYQALQCTAAAWIVSRTLGFWPTFWSGLCRASLMGFGGRFLRHSWIGNKK